MASGNKVSFIFIGMFQSTRRSPVLEASIEALWLMNDRNVWCDFGNRSRSTASWSSIPGRSATFFNFWSVSSRIAFNLKSWPVNGLILGWIFWKAFHTVSIFSVGSPWSLYAKIFDLDGVILLKRKNVKFYSLYSLTEFTYCQWEDDCPLMIEQTS